MQLFWGQIILLKVFLNKLTILNQSIVIYLLLILILFIYKKFIIKLKKYIIIERIDMKRDSYIKLEKSWIAL